MPDPEIGSYETLMKELGNLGTLLGIGSSIQSIFFGGDTLTVPEIVEGVSEAVQQIVVDQQVEANILSATSALATARNFLASDYANAQASGETSAEIWSLFDDSSTAPKISDLKTTASELVLWIGQSNNDPKTVVQAATIGCGLYLIVCAFRSARAAVAPSDEQKNSELADMANWAAQGVTAMNQMIADCITARMACVSISGTNYMPGDYPQIPDNFFFNVTLNDSWGGALLYSWGYTGDGETYLTLMQQAYRTYLRVLWTGADDDFNSLKSQLNERHFNGSYQGLGQGSVDSFLANHADSIQAFGKFAATARGLLMQLDIIAAATKGSSQDSWAWCGKCSSVFFCDAASVCAAGGAHTPQSNDYVFHYDAPAVPAGMQDGWRWCNKCGVMHFDYGTSACPAGGAHANDGGNYLIGYMPVAAALANGLSNCQSNFAYCANCGALHHSFVPGVCPGNGNGAHIQTGSGDYWVSWIPTLAQP